MSGGVGRVSREWAQSRPPWLGGRSNPSRPRVQGTLKEGGFWELKMLKNRENGPFRHPAAAGGPEGQGGPLTVLENSIA